jgi:hypothetical protein
MSALSAAASDEDGDTISALRAENEQLRQSLLTANDTLQKVARAGACHAQAAECLRETVIRWANRAEQAEAMLEAIGAGGVGSLTSRQISEQDIADSALLGNIESAFNACMHQEHCKRWKAQATAAPQSPAATEGDMGIPTSKLPQVEQEPVAWAVMQDGAICWEADYSFSNEPGWCDSDQQSVPLYIHPQPKREPLTDEQIDECFPVQWEGEFYKAWRQEAARAIERAHGIGGEA